jgi:ABC-type multidrug transport system fused ATPase/permease subunit
MRHYNISKRLVEGYLHQPYSWFLNQNSSELGKNILSEVDQVIGNGISQLIEITAKGMIIIFLIGLLIVVDPKLAIIVGFAICGSYGLVFYFIGNYLHRIGKERLLSNESRFRVVSEAFGAAKEVKVGGLEKTYIDRFSDYAYTLARTSSSAQVIKQLPRYFLEAIVFGGILLILLYLMTQKGSFNNALPILSLYVFTGYRLMPAIQQVYASFTSLNFVDHSIDKLHFDLNNLNKSSTIHDQGVLSLNSQISLKNICYNYPNSKLAALNNINLNIPAKSTVGLVGTTGSGKTTTVDIILRLLEPQKGTLEIDGQVISNQNSRAWQRIIGYVPQNIYLCDDNIYSNIAFGVPIKNIDQEAVKKASKIANLHKFVMEELPQQYDTVIGERGIRLSGGQRQRIGIARALYHSPQVLILDEATSALDNHTEQAVMNAVNNIGKDITIIIIAHRLNTVKNCDVIFKFEKGQLIKQGSFDELINI